MGKQQYRRWYERVALLVPGMLGVLVAFAMLYRGVPALQHDWRLPDDSAAFGIAIADYASGWIPNGIGEQQPYPTFYLVSAPLWLLHLVLPPAGVLAVMIFVAVFLAGRSAYRIGSLRGVSPLGCSAIAVFAACNPWVYAKLVAGHVFMVLAYACLLALVAETLRRNPRTAVLVVFGALTILQLQFFIVAVVPFGIFCISQKKWSALAAPWVAALPIAVGIVGEYRSLRGIPYNFAWEQAMSVPPLAGALLSGYTFHYARAFDALAYPAVATALLALSGALFLRNAIEASIVALGGIALLIASGADGPIAPLYRLAVLRFPETGVYRELYDVIALVAIAYVVLLSNALAGDYRWIVSSLTSLMACAMIFVWIKAPPAQLITPWTSISHSAPPPGTARRIAYLPAFQPLTADGNSAGVDPDAFRRPGSEVPINEPLAGFPVDVALALFERDGDASLLHALAVDRIVRRPNLLSVDPLVGTLRTSDYDSSAGTDDIPPAHLFETVPGTPPRVAIANDPRTLGLLFGAPGDVVPMEPMRATYDFKVDWVDARLGFRNVPEWGTDLGGVATTSRLPLAIAPGAVAVLAQTDGTIRDDRGRLVVSHRPQLHWWPLRGDEKTLACNATCIVVALSHVRVPSVDNGPSVRGKAVPFRSIAPFLYEAVIRPHATNRTLRFVERYDEQWVAIGASQTSAHMRLAGNLNGWTLGPDAAERHLLIVERVAATQAITEFAAFVLLTACIVTVSRSVSRAPRPRNG